MFQGMDPQQAVVVVKFGINAVGCAVRYDGSAEGVSCGEWEEEGDCVWV